MGAGVSELGWMDARRGWDSELQEEVWELVLERSEGRRRLAWQVLGKLQTGPSCFQGQPEEPGLEWLP